MKLPDPLEVIEEVDIKKVECESKYPKPFGYLPFKEEENQSSQQQPDQEQSPRNEEELKPEEL